MIPEFAIIGHPNEGKSSVLSTLAEDDSVVISPIPGETQTCRNFPIIIDGKEILQFIDTPGFQNPRRILAGLKKLSATGVAAIQQFSELEKDNPELADDCELLKPIVNGAAIIYVADGSRPLRTVDKIEMEILRLSGQPRMAILNNKENETVYIEEWKEEFRKNFNVSRLFNAHKATYGERIALLQTLKAIDQDLEPTLETIVQAFKKDWQSRNEQVTRLVCQLLEESIAFSLTAPISDQSDLKQIEDRLHKQYCQALNLKEKDTHQKIRNLFKHNIFNLALSASSILHEDLFSDVTWNFLGLSRKQMIIAGGVGGATLGATADVAAHGLSFGLFTSLGAIIGSASTLFGGEKISKNSRFLGIPLGGEEYKIGPNKNSTFAFILLDRALLFYSHIINWAHGRREGSAKEIEHKAQGITATLTKEDLKICEKYFTAVRDKKTATELTEQKSHFSNFLQQRLLDISTRDNL